MKNFKSQTIKATGWAIGSRAMSQVISLGFGIALARLLVPDDFGLIAMVLVFTGLANLLADVGLGSALIQKKDAREEHFSSVFWLNLLLGCAMALILFSLSPWLSDFYGRTEIKGISRVLSLNFLIGALVLIPRIRFVKELSFKYIALSDFVAMVVSGSIAVFLAILGYGYWSLVANILLQSVISTVLIWSFSGWRPKIRICFDSIRELLGFSSYVFATRLLQYGATNIDKLLIGKMLGGQDLGLYDKAHSMMLFPLHNVSHVMGSVMFPALSIIQSDAARVRDLYLRTTRAIVLLTFPMMAGMFVVADSFVFGVLGSHWAALIPILQIFCVIGVVRSVVTVTGPLYLSQGAAALQFRVNLITKPITIIGVIGGLYWGLIGVAAGYAIASVLNSVITLVIAGRLVDLKIFTLVRTLSPTLLPALLMAVLVWLIRPIIGIDNELFLFFTQIIAGGIIYWVCIATMKLRAYLDVKEVLLEEFVSWRNGKKS